MQATKLILTTDENGLIREPPRLPPNARLEATFLVLDPRTAQERKRQPSPRIAGLGSINGDILMPATHPDDWDALQ